jgi:hypothetical protein
MGLLRNYFASAVTRAFSNHFTSSKGKTPKILGEKNSGDQTCQKLIGKYIYIQPNYCRELRKMRKPESPVYI